MKEHKVSKLNEWAKDKPYLLVIMAQQFAIGTEACFKVLKSVKLGDRVDFLSEVPDVKEWLKLYRSHRRILTSVLKRAKGFGEIPGKAADLAEKISLTSKNERKKLISNAENEFNRTRNQHKGEIQSDSMMDMDRAKRITEGLRVPEIAFFFRVGMPCLLLYGDYPQRLFRRARLGDGEALEKLLRLDPSVVSEPRIAEYMHQAKAKGKKATFDLLAEGLKRGPKPKVTLKKIVYRMAGLISLISDLMGRRLTEREICDFFNAFAEDMGKEETDMYIAERPETFARAILRERKFWTHALIPDKR